MLAIARILRTGAKLLLLDEPTEGLAPVIVQQIGQIIAQAQANAASPSCWSSRTSTSPRPSPTATTSSSTARSSTMIRERELDAKSSKLHDYLGRLSLGDV